VNIILTFFYFLSLFYLTADAVIAANFSAEQLSFNSEIMLTIFVLCNLLLYVVNKIRYPKAVIKFNHYFLLPFSFLLSVIIILHNNYPGLLPITLTHSYKKIINIFILSGFMLFIHQKFSEKRDRYIYTGGVFLLVFCIGIYLINYDLLRRIIREDGLFEYLQAVLFFICSYLALKVSLLLKKKRDKVPATLFILLGITFFFVAFEEISWGQRVLDIQTPDVISELNTQNELTIHNLEPIQKVLHQLFMFAGFYGAFGGMVVKKISKTFFKKVKLFFPEKKLFFYFLPILAFYFTYDYLFIYLEYIFGNISQIYVWRWQEIAETHLAIGFFLHMLNVRKKLINKKHT